MREQLLAYLLNELSPDRRRDLERELQRDPSLRAELDRLRACVGAGTDDESPAEEPTCELGARTLQRIRSGDASCHDEVDSAGLALIDSAGSTCHFSLVDTVVTLGVVMALGMMLLPAMVESREGSRRLSCQNNLRQLGVACSRYAENHFNYFPHIRPGENAGFFVVRLAENGGVDPAELQSWLVCASSPAADIAAKSNVRLAVQTTAGAPAPTYQARLLLFDMLPNSYAYRFGYWQGNRYVAVRKHPCRTAPLLADTADAGNGFRSVNHGGFGQNVLLDDLSVAYWTDSWAPDRDDHLFLNKRNEQAAGFGWNDVVLGGSNATPGVTPVVMSISR